ncbi:hypothetical protein COU53_03875 [Candidatus Pacearchaeota archaeon CG10_big_fil_rev_8_21_14_0_10_30_48]|nr:MAG: hypothetical protein COU53_03875 [Candidatus Pacearchaeota archaeon CG10_big_fil_rev_8_21_14_0_10_30_48]
MKKEVLLSFLVILLVLSAGVLAQEISNTIDATTEKFVKGFVEKSDIAKNGEVKSVNSVNQSNLPDDLEIKEINENNLGIYEVNFTDEVGFPKKIFVVTFATNDFKKKEAPMKNVQNLYFGLSTESSKSDYLETSTGVKTGEQIGYVMLREGSVTGISSSLELSGKGKLLISVYKNGVDTGFYNLIDSDGKTAIDFDLQSENVVTYSPGDIISVYVQKSGSVSWNNVVTTVETTN